MRVVFRTDASTVIGSGHVMRCLTLADALRAKGADVVFVCREHPGNMSDFIAGKGYRVARLPVPPPEGPTLDWNRHAGWLGVPQEQDASETLPFLGGGEGCDWLIVDHYALDRTWERALRSKADKIMVIDDLADREHDSDLLLDQNLYERMGQRYEGLVPDSCRILAGPKYALLRPEFIVARGQSRIRDGKVRRLLIFYGGSDLGNETAKALAAIRIAELSDVEVDVVVGAGNPNRHELAQLCASLPTTSFHFQVDKMAELMATADLMLCAGGTITWERCAMGLPGLVIATAANQEDVAENSARNGLSFYLGPSSMVSVEKLANALRALCSASQTLQFFSKAELAAVDARGAQRISGILFPPAVVLRRATLEDCDVVHAWRNAEETRRHIFDQELIPLEHHRTWYRRVLEAPDKVLLIGEVAGESIGVLRFDISGENALVSVYLVPGGQGQGVGTQLIAAGSNWLREFMPEVKVINAEILRINIASLKAFEQAGYREHHLTFQKVLQ